MEDLIAWGRELGLDPRPPRGDLVRLSGLDVGYSITERHEIFTVEFDCPAHDREVLGAFDDVEDARRLLVMEFGGLRRARASLEPLRAVEPPPGYVVEETPTSIWLSWFAGSAEFPADAGGRHRAVTFSRVERQPVEAIDAAFRDPRGRPLFDAA